MRADNAVERADAADMIADPRTEVWRLVVAKVGLLASVNEYPAELIEAAGNAPRCQ
jgi:hypothetical protein